MTRDETHHHAMALSALLPDLRVECEASAVRAALALLTDEAEADRKLGAAVRIAGLVSCCDCNDLDEYAGRLQRGRWVDAAELVVAIAKALREESR